MSSRTTAMTRVRSSKGPSRPAASPRPKTGSAAKGTEASSASTASPASITAKFKPKDRVETTPAFSELFDGGAHWTGTVLSAKSFDKFVQYMVQTEQAGLCRIGEKWLKKETKR